MAFSIGDRVRVSDVPTTRPGLAGKLGTVTYLFPGDIIEVTYDEPTPAPFNFTDDVFDDFELEPINDNDEEESN